MKIFVILPAYNESENLPQLIVNLHKDIRKTKKSYQIIIVDDGSTDDTQKVMSKYMSNFHIKIVAHSKNRGLGAAMNTGFTSALKKAEPDDLIISMDADNTHDTAAIAKMVDKFEQGYDLILASRFSPGGGDQGIPFLRRFLSHQSGRIFQTLFPIRGVREYTCSFRGYRASLIKSAYAYFANHFIAEKGFNCMLEILVKLSRFSPKTVEIPFILFYDRKRGKSKMDIKKTLIRYIYIALDRKRFIE